MTMTMNPSLGLRPISPRRMITALLLVLVAASTGSGTWSATRALAPAHSTYCKCANCPGGDLCCCKTESICNMGGVK